MADSLIQTATLTAIADAIRAKNGSSDTYLPSQMASAISNISCGLGFSAQNLSCDTTCQSFVCITLSLFLLRNLTLALSQGFIHLAQLLCSKSSHFLSHLACSGINKKFTLSLSDSPSRVGRDPLKCFIKLRVTSLLLSEYIIPEIRSFFKFRYPRFPEIFCSFFFYLSQPYTYIIY